ncbi:bacterio-opsin activator domain-containing protein [Halegenticoccus tardaugens]|uniref:bacterio-opsin activator domain-containing protein n=1 Tax=Halegenticoccus tardaugens TaxID=2071624 RepID=UPI00100B0CFD|nr:bacterio-opsin activator domain-containing protein [Halegenticoccus tardaugens]
MGEPLEVVVVGDDEWTGRLCDSLGRDHGFAVVAVENEGDVVGSLSSTTDCVVGDGLFDAAGLATVESIRERRAALPVVLLHRSGDEAGRALDAGADRCVRRVGDAADVAAELAAVIRDAVDAYAAARTLPGETDLVGDALDTLSDVFFVFGLDGSFLRWNDRLPAVTGYGDDAIAEMAPTDFVAPEDVDAITVAIQRVMEEGQAQERADLLTTDGERIPYEFTGSLLRDEAGAPVAICGIGRDITERKRRERALERQAERLETLNHVNAVIRDVNEALVRASTREEIERAVCEHLAAEEPYRFAWIGEFDFSGGRVEPRAWAGVEDGYLDARSNAGDGSDERVTAATAVREGTVIVEQNIADDVAAGSWREAALERGYRSAAAIPLTYRDATYGVLCVYAPRSNAFDETERAVLAELGETIAYAMCAVEQRRALVTDSVVELTVRFDGDGSDPAPFFVESSASTDATVSLEGVVEGSDGSLAEFLTVDDGSADAVIDLVGTRGGDARRVAEYDGVTVLRVSTPARSVASLVADHGGVLRDASADEGVGEIRIELPQRADVRTIMDAIRGRYPGAELRAQRERERTSTRGLEFRDAFDGTLTDRQREVLETAYLAGYFEWPRGSTAEEVAASLDISPPTFHEHIRRVQNKLLGAFFGRGDGDE